MNEILNCSIVREEIVQAIKLNDEAPGTDGIIVEIKNGLEENVPLLMTF